MKKINIVGGGLVGSLLATYLGKRGHQVHVYERRPDMRKATISAGKSINMACSTRGWKALDHVGVGQRIREAAIPMYGRMMHSQAGDLTFQPYGKEDQAIYSISRAGLNKILMSYAHDEAGVNFSFNEKCVDVDLDSATLHFENSETGAKTKVEGDHVFGADGAFSAVRYVMQKNDRFTYSQTYISHSYKELYIPPADDGGFRMEKNALHIWPRGQFMLIALPNPDGSFTCTLFLPHEGAVSFEGLTTDEEIMDFFNREFPDAVAMMPNLLEVYHSNPTSSLAIIRCFPWSHKDKVCLIGDASHAIVPFYGQGMISGFEDCNVLDGLLNEHGEDWDAIFNSFERMRKPNGDAIADLAMRNFVEMRDLVGDPLFLMRKKLEKKIHELYPDRFTPLYTMVSFSNTPYAEAKAIGEQQDELLNEIMNTDNFETLIENGGIEQVIHDKMNA